MTRRTPLPAPVLRLEHPAFHGGLAALENALPGTTGLQARTAPMLRHRMTGLEGPVHLIAEGPAAHTALMAAASAPWQVKSLTLVDPEIAMALRAMFPPNTLQALRAHYRACAQMVKAGDHTGAQSTAGSFWSGDAPRSRAGDAPALIAAIADQAQFPIGDEALRAIACPVLVITGAEARPEMHRTRALLLRDLRFAETAFLPGPLAVPHLAKAGIAMARICSFLVGSERRWHSIVGQGAAA